ncbi:MAG: hypothetical protein ACI97K_002478 [Glaciecola sp.]|jgi:hypothetical protein
MNEFTITGWDESTHKEQDNIKLSHASVTQSYVGILEGAAEISYQMVYTDKTKASYIGTERFEGTIDGRVGSVMFVHRGTYANGKVTSNFEVVPDTGTGELKGILGKGKFASGESQSVSYTFDYDL